MPQDQGEKSPPKTKTKLRRAALKSEVLDFKIVWPSLPTGTATRISTLHVWKFVSGPYSSGTYSYDGKGTNKETSHSLRII